MQTVTNNSRDLVKYFFKMMARQLSYSDYFSASIITWKIQFCSIDPRTKWALGPRA